MDDLVFVDLPNRKERLEVFRIHLQKRNRDASTFDLEAMTINHQLPNHQLSDFPSYPKLPPAIANMLAYLIFERG